MRRRAAVVAIALCPLTALLSAAPAGASTPSWQQLTLSSKASSVYWTNVSCWAQQDCLVVGAHSRGFTLDQRGAAVRLTGQRRLRGPLSCIDARWCMATGWTLSKTYAQRWTGRRWSSSTKVHSGNPYGPLPLTVTCPSKRSCFAAGTLGLQTKVDCPVTSTTGYCDTAEPILLHWGGHSWKQVSNLPLPVPIVPRVPVVTNGPIVALGAITCAGNRSCELLGEWWDGSTPTHTTLFADRWNGHVWKLMRVPTPRRGAVAEVNSVSCVAADSCLAVGDYRRNHRRFPLAFRWNGQKWSFAQSRPPDHLRAVIPVAVSCVHHGPCTAVGDEKVARHHPFQPFAERWHAGHWKVESVPVPPLLSRRKGAALDSISCPAAGFCEAVGTYGFKSDGTSYGAFIDRYS